MASGHLQEVLLPEQVGCGTPAGAEAAIHSLRAYLEQGSPSLRVLVKLDFRNAFNTVNRDHLLECIRESTPELFPLAYQAYRHPSFLFYGDHTLMSRNGVQQGDPAGPAFFCLALRPLTRTLQSVFRPWFLDDGALGGSLGDVLADIERVQAYEHRSGLALNDAKCELLIVGGSDGERAEALASVKRLLPRVLVVDESGLELLGAPIADCAVSGFLDAKLDTLNVMCDRLKLLDSQTAFYLLRSSLSAPPRLTYALRCTRAYRSEAAVGRLDSFYRALVQDLLNLELDDTGWAVASLPIAQGGLGVRSPRDMARVAYASSLAATSELCHALAPEAAHETLRSTLRAEEEHFANQGITGEVLRRQGAADHALCAIRREAILQGLQTPRERALLLAATDPLSGKWLHALPSPALGTTLDTEQFRVAAALRLGSPLCAPHQCGYCPDPVDQYGDHHLVCASSQGRQPRHRELNDVIHRSLRRAQVPAILEPAGLSAADGRRPDGQSITTWSQGKCVVWDATVACTTAPSHLAITSRCTGAAARRAEGIKLRRYSDLAARYIVTPVAFETTGVAGPLTTAFITELGRRMTSATGEPRETDFLWQRLSIVVQRGNAAAILLGAQEAAGLR